MLVLFTTFVHILYELALNMTLSEELNFEQLKFDPFKSNSILLENLSEIDLDPNENTKLLNTPYLLPEETPQYLS